LSKYVQPRPCANPEAASRKPVEIAHAIDAGQRGWLVLHESGTFVRFITQGGKDLFAD
jgi:hypothetical protein